MSEILFLIAAIAAAVAAVFAWATALWGNSRRDDLHQQLLVSKEREIASLRRELKALSRIPSDETSKGLSAALAASNAWSKELEEKVETLEVALARHESSEIGKAAQERERIKRGLAEVSERFGALNRAVSALQRSRGLQAPDSTAPSDDAAEEHRPGRVDSEGD